jgi:hypothetical protein
MFKPVEITIRGDEPKERVWEGEYGRNIMYTCMKIEK